MEPTPHPLTLTVGQAAKVLGIGRSTAYELVHTGAIPSLRLGRRIVVPSAKLAERLGLPPNSVLVSAPAVGRGDCSPTPIVQKASRPNPGAERLF